MRQRLSSIQFAWHATLACTLIAGPHFGCGKVEEGPDLGTPSGGAVGANSSGGTTANSSGGSTAISSGGVVGATGGGLQVPNEEPPPEPGPCEVLPELDPPCSEEDVHGTLYSCLGSETLTFEFPLATLELPAEHLRLVCLPVDAGLGAGGMGGSDGLNSAVVFDLGYLYPSSAGEVESDSTFSLTTPAEAIESETSFDALPTACIETRGEYPDSYLFAEVAVMEEDIILAQHRLLLHGRICLK